MEKLFLIIRQLKSEGAPILLGTEAKIGTVEIGKKADLISSIVK